MFAIKRLVLIAACVAVSLGPSIAKLETSHFRIRVRGGHDISAGSTKEAASDELTASLTTPDALSLNKDNTKTNSTNPSADNSDDTIDMTILVDELCTGMGESPMSVEGVEGVFCVTGPACVADNADGACPGPQEGLEFGASCGKVITGVYGCKPNTAAPADYSGESDESSESEDGSEEEPTTLCTGMGESPMSVEGVEGVFCVTGPACVADNADGACPGPQEGLEFGASCGKVITGVYGCKPNGAPKDEDKNDSVDSIDTSLLCAGEGRSQMSVEGVTGIFCVSGSACVADNADGACPGPQEGLPNGSECGKVATGVYGCKPTAVTRLRHKKHSSKSDKHTATKDKKTKHQHKKTHHTNKH